ncbi:MAG: discoidin domain-containing protein [Candidatus Competibacter sp.]|nr:discoidin domain-containing protein [Candidatus Competibacter sp.]
MFRSTVLSGLLTAILLVTVPPLPAATPENPAAPPAAVPPVAPSGTSVRKTVVLDDFEDLGGWSVVTSPGARLEIAQDSGHVGRSMRLDFEFQDGAGYAIVRKTFSLRLPENFAFRFHARGEGPTGNVEFKLVDPRQSVWWLKRHDYTFPREWEELTVKKRHLSLAWGPGGALDEVTAIEFAIAPGKPGKGSVWIDDLTFEEREAVRDYTLTPAASASTAAEGQPPEAVLDPDLATRWHSGALADDQWLMLDFLLTREYGGLIIDWDPDDYATDYQTQVSDNGKDWKTVYTVRDGNGRRDYIFLPNVESRYLRLNLQRSSRGQGYGIGRLAVQSYDFSATPNRFFEAIARDAPRGYYPRFFQGEQGYWTVIGVGGDGKEALLGEDGALEIDKAGFTIEPFLFAEGRLITWADVDATQELADGYLPVPTVRWQHENFWLSITAFAAGRPGDSSAYLRYRIENLSAETRHVSLFLAVRPFQVNPPWQSLNMTSGVSPIHELDYADRVIRVNGHGKSIAVLTAPDRFRAATFDQGSITDYLAAGKLPDRTRVEDGFGYASGALEYGWDLRPGEAREVYLRVPFHSVETGLPAPTDADAAAQVNRLLEQTRRDWEARLDRVGLELPPAAGRLARTIKSNLAYILINRDGSAIQPGSRAYARSWIRDGALTSAALLGMGYTQEVREFLQWYAPYQFADGKVPCCVDGRGADPTPEHDSHGELIYTVMEYYRYTRDVGFLREMWPYVLKAVGYIDYLRQQRLTDIYRTPELCMYCGLVPESISHEGYSTQPRHSYWDNFFILRGLKDAADMAAILGEDGETARIAAMRDAFRKDLYASILETMKLHQIDYIPGAVELGDFDPTSTTVAIDPGGELGWLPQPALDRTFERYAEFFRARRDDRKWIAYTPYEWRVVGTMIRLGFRDRALEALEFFFEGQRPAAWNQWAEVVWREPRAPRFIGDMPHTWVGSDFIRSARSLFVYEREADQALVIGAGIPAAWVENPEGIAVKRMPTWHGTLNYRMAMSGPSTLRVQLSGDVTVPPGRIILHSPLDRPLREVTVGGRPATTFTASTLTLDQFPAEVELRY